MSTDDEPFLARWSRLKRRREPQPGEESGPGTAAQPDTDKSAEGARKDLAERERGQTGQSEPPLDLSKLPKIEELTADSDFAQFMDPRVPSSLRQAALRRAWTLDPRIRDFVEMSDWNYDWNVPGGAPCYGPMPTGTKVGELLAQVFQTSSKNVVQEASKTPDYDKLSHSGPDTTGAPSQIAGEEAAAMAPAETEAAREKPLGASRVAEAHSTSVERENEAPSRMGYGPPRRRRHGGALPV
ncbi:MAG TPA: DUF3306 domain-containing protein [Hyphomicrobiaceae bacterium]|nr:DUF3306 domain-containing protein [Hyphomicrobiaceae bacterium]